MNPIGLWAIAGALVILPAYRRAAYQLNGPAGGPSPADSPAVANDPLAAATAFDLLAACLRAGLPMASAAAAVARFAPEPLGASLRQGADLMALGADSAVAWSDSTDVDDEACRALARMARRSARSGASLADGIAELAEQRRTAAADAAAAKAERAGVLIAGPLGLCFLPAFVCLGIVPVVVGLFGRVLGGGLL